jgi:hypothetical protein
MRMIAYGAPGDTVDDYFRMAESTTIESMYWYFKAVMVVFGPDYLRGPEAERTRIMAYNAARGFLEMLESIDCIHWSWKNYPFACQVLCKRAS